MRWLVLPLMALLAGCGLKIPDPAVYTAACPTPRAVEQALADDALFFMSTALRDCRKGALTYAGYREPAESWGQAVRQGALTGDRTTFAAQEYTHAAWLAMLAKRVHTPGNRGRLLVFIHGFNNSFDDTLDAAWKVSRLSEKGVPVVVLRWPSRARLQSYIFDEDSVVWAQPKINRTIVELARLSSDMTIIAHSMGARAAIGAIGQLDQANPELAGHVRRVVLASPDYDRDAAFEQGGALDLLLAFDRKVLVYTSRRDGPLTMSRLAHGYARLGNSSCLYDVRYDRRALGEQGWCHLARPRPNLAVVETSLVASSGMRHSDYVNSCPVRVDLGLFLRGEIEPSLRQKLERDDGTVGYQIDPKRVAASGLCGT